ncbi:MAG: 5'-nucleotidase C-terminal domain-containing protein [Dysgonamonadaceae bacterium]|jgi:2',3'-cyclic-nucleotide 2'-phosphodiesterase (5'-nucleotidase family)|nr:5'-nucleotidase C-terminal domain-containing protein [Dysgonamonadaceae bacterium]
MKKINLKITGMLFIAVVLTTACAKKQYTVKNIEVARVEMDSTWEPVANTEMRALVNSLHAKMTEETQTVIGTAGRKLTKGKPQSLLSNFTADAIFDYASGLWKPVDFAVINIGGIRNILNQGPITLGNMYEIFPFDNRIVLLELPGKAVEEFFDSIAKKEGEGLSKNIEVVIKNKTVYSLKIGGKAIDGNQIYLVATVDYLAEGNDRMEALTKAVKITDSNMLIRDALIEYVKKQTAENKAIDSNLDNRITILQ